METEEAETVELLKRWHAGDAEALARLVARDLEWVRARVRRRLGPLLRAKEETDDVVQDAVVELLRYGPRHLLRDRSHFRALLARIVENVLRGHGDRFQAYKRAARREVPLAGGGLLDERLIAPGTTPSEAAAKGEWQALLRLGLELLDLEGRELLLLREWDGLTFPQVAARLGVSEDAARMRCQRALARLASILESLRAGRLGDLFTESEGS